MSETVRHGQVLLDVRKTLINAQRVYSFPTIFFFLQTLSRMTGIPHRAHAPYGVPTLCIYMYYTLLHKYTHK